MFTLILLLAIVAVILALIVALLIIIDKRFKINRRRSKRPRYYLISTLFAGLLRSFTSEYNERERKVNILKERLRTVEKKLRNRENSRKR